MSLIKLNLENKIYHNIEEDIEVFKNFSIEFPNNGFVAIVGKSGSGKTTLLNILGINDRDYSGNLYIDGVDINKLSFDDLDEFRSENISYIFQDSLLLNNLSIEKNIKIACINLNITKIEIENMLTSLNLNLPINKKVKYLSGGEKQRLCLAISLLRNTKIILCDEVTGNLDEENSESVFKILKEISKERLVILVSHDIKNCNEYADKIISLNDRNVLLREASATKENNFHKKRNSHFCFRHIKNVFTSLFSKRFTTIIINTIFFSLSLLFLCGTICILSYNPAKILVDISSLREEKYSPILEEYSLSLNNDKSSLQRNVLISNQTKNSEIFNDILYYKPLTYKIFYDLDIIPYNNPNEFPFMRYVNSNENLIAGRLPENKEEVLLNKKAYLKYFQKGIDDFISEPLAEGYFTNMTELDFENNNYYVVGIIDEEVTEYPIIVLHNSHKYNSTLYAYNPFGMYYSTFDKNNHYQITEGVLSSFKPYDELNELDTIIEGRAPLNNNEFVISQKYITNVFKKLNIDYALDDTIDYMEIIESFDNYEVFYSDIDYRQICKEFKIVGISNSDVSFYCNSEFYSSLVSLKESNNFFCFVNLNYDNYKTILENESYYLINTTMYTNRIKTLPKSFSSYFIFSGVSLLVSILIIITDLVHLIKYRKKEIGLLRTYGYKEKEINICVLIFFAIPIIIGTIINMLIGPIYIKYFNKYLLDYLFPLNEYNLINLVNFNYFIVFAFMVCAIIILFLVVYLSLRKIRKLIKWYNQ